MSEFGDPDLDLLFGPLRGSEKLALAVSGGPDSLALMLLAHAWAKDSGPALVVYSVDHGLRPEAADEVAMVLREAAKLGLAARALRWEGDKPTTGIQAAARAARYGLMAAAMHEDHAEWLLTAHHLEDQAETVLMRLAHGSGLEGLKGMLAYSMVDGLSIARPLLGTPKEELLAVVESAGLTPALDPSNANEHYERVRWRQAMPELEALGLDAERLALFARRIADADEAIAAMAATLVTKWLGERPPSENIVVSRSKLLGTSTAVAVKALGRMIGMVGDSRKAHDLGRVERLLERLAASDVMKPVTLHGCIIASDGETVSIHPEGARRSPVLLTAN